MRIAVIGSGISGLVAAYRLSAAHEVTVFESEAWAGGHTHTVDVDHAGRRYAIDTGFIVFNDWTYPNFIALLDELGVAWQPSAMSFSVRCERSCLEYNGTTLNTLFAQRRNLVSPRFIRMVRDILRFNREALAVLDSPDTTLTLGQLLEAGGFSRGFIDHYIVPMGAAIWSSRPAEMLRFPARFFVEFFSNHGFLSVNERPVWRVIQGGSREYVKKLSAPFANRVRLNAAVTGVQRQAQQVVLRLKDGSLHSFDSVVFACHSDTALAMLSDPSREEREVLGAIGYQANEVTLHTDARLMPRRRLAWAAWNYHLPKTPAELVTVTYNMNILQSLDAPVQFMVSLNRASDIDPATVLGSYTYHHPVYTTAAIAAQQRRAEISGPRRTYYCGAYWSYGFHEDGVRSALAAVAELNRRHDEQLHLQRVG